MKLEKVQKQKALIVFLSYPQGKLASFKMFTLMFLYIYPHTLFFETPSTRVMVEVGDSPMCLFSKLRFAWKSKCTFH